MKYVNSRLSPTQTLDGPLVRMPVLRSLSLITPIILITRIINKVMNAVLRNFGGKPRESARVLEIFVNSLGISLDRVPPLGVVCLPPLITCITLIARI